MQCWCCQWWVILILGEQYVWLRLALHSTTPRQQHNHHQLGLCSRFWTITSLRRSQFRGTPTPGTRTRNWCVQQTEQLQGELQQSFLHEFTHIDLDLDRNIFAIDYLKDKTATCEEFAAAWNGLDKATCRTGILMCRGVLQAQQDQTGPWAQRVHLMLLQMPLLFPNLLTTALPLLYHASDPLLSYLTVSRILYLIKLECTEPAVTRARPYTVQTFLAQLHEIYQFICLVLSFYKLLWCSSLLSLPLLIISEPFTCAACVIS